MTALEADPDRCIIVYREVEGDSELISVFQVIILTGFWSPILEFSVSSIINEVGGRQGGEISITLANHLIFASFFHHTLFGP